MTRTRWAGLTLLMIATAACGEPHYGALFGQSCFLCHANPTGKGMRSLYASQFFGPTYLSFKPVSFDLLEKVKPQLSETVTLGADLRTIWISENTMSDTASAGLSAPLSTNTGTISQMEGYIYLSIQPVEQFEIYYSQGMAQASGRFEAYGLLQGLPIDGFVKAGQFQESFGWTFADHTSFVRTGLWSDYSGSVGEPPTPPHYGLGAEIGARPLIFDITASFTNKQTSYPTARDVQKRWCSRLQVQQGIERLNLQVTLGGSWTLAPSSSRDPEYGYLLGSSRDEAWGGFGGIGWQGFRERLGCHGGFGFLTTSLLFEYDRRAWTPGFISSTLISSAYSTTQVSVMAQPGVWLVGGYD